ncbi:MAG: hypothetical protein UY41_C0022G0001 [Candidatus Moranbacteria bacterium GW2011_GWE1_49_15]|nr:MAG: hypothetical protein UX75_C0041G0011 [Candidatus Moranbacteria bacterium GW2011_GWE2_47_10]KKW06522.1 MAG: hypothetical protein UY41_C0022G0001 [Candidatus Moranbacteria bacterium GW2011_GWE1_49_15]
MTRCYEHTKSHPNPCSRGLGGLELEITEREQRVENRDDGESVRRGFVQLPRLLIILPPNTTQHHPQPHSTPLGHSHILKNIRMLSGEGFGGKM